MILLLLCHDYIALFLLPFIYIYIVLKGVCHSRSPSYLLIHIAAPVCLAGWLYICIVDIAYGAGMDGN